MGVPNRIMAPHTTQHVVAFFLRQHVVNKVAVAIQACILRHQTIARLDLYGLVKLPRRKRQRMQKPVIGFGEPLAQEIVGHMAVVACGNPMVTGMRPRIQMPLHHVAVGTRCGIVRQVRSATTVVEREHAQSGKTTPGNDRPGRQTPPEVRFRLRCGCDFSGHNSRR